MNPNDPAAGIPGIPPLENTVVGMTVKGPEHQLPLKQTVAEYLAAELTRCEIHSAKLRDMQREAVSLGIANLDYGHLSSFIYAGSPF